MLPAGRLTWDRLVARGGQFVTSRPGAVCYRVMDTEGSLLISAARRPQADAAPVVDEDARLFAALYGDLVRFAAVVGRQPQDAEDLVQAAVERVLRRGRLSDLDEPVSYLRKAIVNLASNERRRKARHRRAVLREPLGGDVEDEDPFQLEVLDALSAADRALLWMVDVERWDFATAATVAGCSEVAARARASRARQVLRTSFRSTHG